MSFGPNLVEEYTAAAEYVKRILKRGAPLTNTSLPAHELRTCHQFRDRKRTRPQNTLVPVFSRLRNLTFQTLLQILQLYFDGAGAKKGHAFMALVPTKSEEKHEPVSDMWIAPKPESLKAA